MFVEKEASSRNPKSYSGFFVQSSTKLSNNLACSSQLDDIPLSTG
jgi:hypothetical protein